VNGVVKALLGVTPPTILLCIAKYLYVTKYFGFLRTMIEKIDLDEMKLRVNRLLAQARAWTILTISISSWS
jgi:hypothetical protein